jgi:hypothetical protein
MVVHLLVVLVCVSACETERLYPHSGTRVSDASLNKSPETSPTAAQAPTKRDASVQREAAAPREAATPGEATTPREAGPAKGDANCVEPAVPVVDPGDPPPECMRKCLWDLLKRCSPHGCCAETRNNDNDTAVACASDNDWWRITAYPGDRLKEVYVGGSLCYRAVLTVASSTFYGDYTHWFDGQGTFIAGESMPLRGGDLLGYCDGEDSFSGAVIDYRAPHCSPWLPWRFPVCTSGTCAGTPPGAPPY